MKNIALIIVAIIIVAGGAWLYSYSSTTIKDKDVIHQEEVLIEEDGDSNKEENYDEAMMEVGDVVTKEFELDAFNFGFSTTEIRVKQGDTVKIVLTNSDGLHDWVVDGFNVSTKQIKVGEIDTIEFVVDQKGTFEYYCSVGTHRQMGMVGTLIVE